MSRDVETIFLRLKYLCSRYGKVAAIALVVVSSVALAGSAVAYTAPPETTQVTQQTDVQSFTTTIKTSAAVTGNTTLYDADDQLSNMPVYLLAASPEMTLRAHADVPDDRAVEVTQQVTMELYATRDDEVFWTETETLATDSRRVTDGSLVTETTVNVNDIRRGRLREVQPEINNVGTLGANLHVDTVYNSDTYQGHLTVTTPVEITDRAYSVETPQSDEARHGTPVTRTLRRSGDAITFGSPSAVNGTAQAGIGSVFGGGPVTIPKESAIRGGIGILGLLGALVIWRIYSKNPDWREIKRSYDKARYGEWISLGTVPTGAEYEHVAISGLTDLLDIAIDSNKRIIHDPDRALYAVVDNGIVYEYNEALDQFDSPEHSYIDVSGKSDAQLITQDQEPFFDVSTTETGDSVWDSLGDEHTHDGPNTEQESDSLPASDVTVEDPAEEDVISDLADTAATDTAAWERFSDLIDVPDDTSEEWTQLDPTGDDGRANMQADD